MRENKFQVTTKSNCHYENNKYASEHSEFINLFAHYEKQIKLCALTFAFSFVRHWYCLPLSARCFPYVADTVIGDTVSSANLPCVIRSDWWTMSTAADTVWTQVLVEETSLAGRAANPVARACGQFDLSATSQLAYTLYLTITLTC